MLGRLNLISHRFFNPLNWQEPQSEVNKINGRALTRNQLSLRDCKWKSIHSREVELYKSFDDESSFSELYETVSRYCEKLIQTEAGESHIIEVLENIIDSLRAFEENDIPEKCPDFSHLQSDEKDDDFIKIVKLFACIRRHRTCLSLDKTFVRKMAKFLKDKKCIEIYAGNGWLSDELKKQGINIEASDDFSSSEYCWHVRDVTKKGALSAVKEFLKSLAQNEKGCILLAFPIFYPIYMKLIFDELTLHTNCSIIAVNMNERPIRQWCLTQYLNCENMTNTLRYSPSNFGEQVMCYSVKRIRPQYGFLL